MCAIKCMIAPGRDAKRKMSLWHNAKASAFLLEIVPTRINIILSHPSMIPNPPTLIGTAPSSQEIGKKTK